MSDDIRSHIPALKLYSRALCGTTTDADDLVQETLLRAIECAHGYTPNTNMRAWLFTIMRSRFLNNCNKRDRERTGTADCVSLLPQVEADQDWHVSVRELQNALMEMPRHYREAIVLVGAMGVSYMSAADILGCDIGTIKSRVNRARRILRQALEIEAST